MKCDDCQQNPVVITIAEAYEGKHSELHLCAECAAKRGYFNLMNGVSLPMLLGSFFGMAPLQMGQVGTMPSITCPNCGISLQKIVQQGKLGCSQCYEVFREQMEPTLRRIHSNTVHTGKIPRRGATRVMAKRKTEELKAKLQAAVAAEEYELAAELRDEIKSLEKN